MTARQMTYNNFEISLMVFMPNIITNHAITKTNNYNQTVIENKINVTLIET